MTTPTKPDSLGLARTKIMDVMHTLSVIRDGKAVNARLSAAACYRVLNEALNLLEAER
jgi:hypothetical protein